MNRKATLLALLLLSIGIAQASIYSSELTPPAGSSLKLNVIDKASGAFVPSTISVKIEYPSPNSAKNYQYNINLSKQGEDLSLMMPPSEYNTTSRISATATGYKASSDELVITSAQYWAGVTVGQSNEGRPYTYDEKPASIDYKTPTDVVPNPPSPRQLAEHTFTLERQPGFVPKGASPGSSSAGCFGPALIVLAIIGFALIARN